MERHLWKVKVPMNKKALYNKIAGFVDGEGSFNIVKPKNHSLSFSFSICLSEKDEDLLRMIKKVLECGNIYRIKERTRIGLYTARPQWMLIVRNFKDIYDKIIPFFDRYTLMSKKRIAYEIWKQAIEIAKNRKRNSTNCWTKQEIKKILRLRELMGQRRLKP